MPRKNSTYPVASTQGAGPYSRDRAIGSPMAIASSMLKHVTSTVTTAPSQSKGK